MEETAVSRKNWSNLFLLLAAVSLMLALLPSNPVRLLTCVAIPGWVALGTVSRRRMA
jgi:hypothetical protein